MRNHRRKHSEEHENHERWLVSYADFITLLFAFFVVMFASAQADSAPAKEVSAAITTALREGTLKDGFLYAMGTNVDTKSKANDHVKPGGKSVEKKEGELSEALEVLTKELTEEINTSRIQIMMEPRGLVISLTQATFFPSGGDEIAPESLASLEKVARVIAKVPNQIRLEGHTDAMPISTSRFRSNWDLSAARSIAMLQLLHEKFGIPVSRMAVVGYAETVALDTNETETGRARNRRVDVTILNAAGLLKESRVSHK